MSKKSKARRRAAREAKFKKMQQVQELKNASGITKKENNKNSNVITKSLPTHGGLVTYKKRPPCHICTEIYPNLWLGNLSQRWDMVDNGCDVLVPLDSIDGNIWKDFNGEIHYWPIEDMSVLPTHVLDRAVNDIISCLKAGKKVGMFCIGGHGRTGYLAACVLGKLGINDPIQHIHENYCIKAIEVCSQYRHIATYLNKPELFDHYIPSEYDMIGYGYSWGGYGAYSEYNLEDDYNFAGIKDSKYFESVFKSIPYDDDEDDEENIDVNQYLLKQEGAM